MIVNPEWLKPKKKPYFHQISMDCLEKLVKCIGMFNNDEMDALFVKLAGPYRSVEDLLKIKGRRFFVMIKGMCPNSVQTTFGISREKSS